MQYNKYIFRLLKSVGLFFFPFFFLRALQLARVRTEVAYFNNPPWSVEVLPTPATGVIAVIFASKPPKLPAGMTGPTPPLLTERRKTCDGSLQV